MILPTIPGLTILSEIGRDAFSRRFRLMDPRPGILVLYVDPVAEEHAFRARRALGTETKGSGAGCSLASIERVVELDGRRGFVLRADTGENPWSHAQYGELDAMPVVEAVASCVAHLLRSGLGGHGALRMGAIELLYGGGVQILPPFVLEAWLSAKSGAPAATDAVTPPGHQGLSVPARDLSDVAGLMAWLIGGVALTRAAGPSALPADLAENASPAARRKAQSLLELAATNPTPAAAAAALDRISRRVSASSGAEPRRQTRPATSRDRPAETRDRSAERGDGRERAPRAPANRGGSGVVGTALVGLVVLLGGAWFFDGGATVRRLFGSIGQDNSGRLVGPKDPMGGGPGASEAESSGETSGETSDETSDEAGKKPQIGEAEPQISDATPEELAKKILADIAAKRAARNKPPIAPKRSYDRTKIEDGDRLKKAGEEVVRKVIQREIPFSERNANLEQAIKLLEDARNKYLGFVEQYPDKERLVEGTVEDVNAILKLAYKSKTH